MDTVTLTKQNRLFWLGRYSERVSFSIQYMIQVYDDMLSEKKVDYQKICADMGIPCTYSDTEQFCRQFTFDATSPYSIRTNAENMLGNGMVLRETLSSATLAYLQMSRNHIVVAEHSDAPALNLQEAIDCIMAFRGSFDDYIESEVVRNIMKTGRAVERLSLMLRLNWKRETMDKELRKLQNRLYKTDLVANKAALDIITEAAEGKTIEDRQLLQAVEGLFQV